MSWVWFSTEWQYFFGFGQVVLVWFSTEWQYLFGFGQVGLVWLVLIVNFDLVWEAITIWFGLFSFGLVWYGFSILIWFGGSPGLPSPPGSLQPPTAPHSFHNPA